MAGWHLIKGRPEWFEGYKLRVVFPQGGQVDAEISDCDGDFATWEVREDGPDGKRGLHGEARDLERARVYAELVVCYGVETVKGMVNGKN